MIASPKTIKLAIRRTLERIRDIPEIYARKAWAEDAETQYRLELEQEAEIDAEYARLAMLQQILIEAKRSNP